MIPAAVLMKLATLGLTSEHAEAVAGMLAEVEAATKAETGTAIEARRASDRERKARQRHVKSRDVTGRDGTSGTTPSPKRKVSPCTPSKENNPSPRSSNEFDREGIAAEFEETFWPEWPDKTAKKAAQKAWPAARKSASLEAIMTGLRRYVATKPADRSWMNPATFLNGERWTDQPAQRPLRLVRAVTGDRGEPRGSPPPRMKSVAEHMVEMADRIARGEMPEDQPNGNFVDGVAVRR